MTRQSQCERKREEVKEWINDDPRLFNNPFFQDLLREIEMMDHHSIDLNVSAIFSLQMHAGSGIVSLSSAERQALRYERVQTLKMESNVFVAKPLPRVRWWPALMGTLRDIFQRDPYRSILKP